MRCKFPSYIDTGAGVTCGAAEYHLDIAKTCPEIVAQLVSLDDHEGVEPFRIGGVGGTDDDGNSDTGCTVTHIVTYKTTMAYEHRPIFLTVALVDKCATDTILGLPFMLMADFNVLLPSMTIVADKLGLTLPMRLKNPSHSNRAPSSVPEGPLTLLADTASRYHSVTNGDDLMRLTEQLNAVAIHGMSFSTQSVPNQAITTSTGFEDEDSTPIRRNPRIPVRSVTAFTAAVPQLQYEPGLHLLAANPTIGKPNSWQE